MKRKAIFILALGATLIMGACGASKETPEQPGNDVSAEVTKAPEATSEQTVAETKAPVPTLAISGNEKVNTISVELKSHTVEGVAVKVEIPEYKGVKLQNATDDDLKEAIQTILENSVYSVEVDGTAAEGDTLNINYAGYMDGVQFQGGTNDSEAGYDLTLGSHSFISGFEEGLIGATKGQEVDLNISFPDPYPNNPDLAGKPVLFKVKVNKISRSVTPEFNDEFAQIAGFNTADEAREDIRKELNATYHKQGASDYLWQNSVVSGVPESEIKDIVDNFVNLYVTYAQEMAQLYGMEADYLFEYITGGLNKEQFTEKATVNLTETIQYQYITEAIFEHAGLAYTEEEYMSYVENYMSEYGIESYEEFLASGDKDNIINAVKANKAIEYIIDNAEIVTE